jgi:hypothetical protein
MRITTDSYDSTSFRKSSERFIRCLAPMGTTRPRKDWRSGGGCVADTPLDQGPTADLPHKGKAYGSDTVRRRSRAKAPHRAFHPKQTDAGRNASRPASVVTATPSSARPRASRASARSRPAMTASLTTSSPPVASSLRFPTGHESRAYRGDRTELRKNASPRKSTNTRILEGIRRAAA